MRIVVLTLALVVLCAGQARAEWQLRPFAGLTFGGGTTFFDLEHASGKPNPAIGFNALWLGEFIGVDADLGYAPGFFQHGEQSQAASVLVSSSRVTTLTGSLVVALPRRVAEYTLRPYFTVGAGLMHVRSIDPKGVLSISTTLPAVDIGGGATGFLTDRVGIGWDVRHFRSTGGEDRGFSFGPEHLSFWRATMAVAFRY